MTTPTEIEDLLREAERIDRSGRIRLRTLGDVEAWAADHGGELGVRIALADQTMMEQETVRIAKAWLAELERHRTDEHANQALAIDMRAAQAAERAARYSMWSALVSAAAAIVSAAAYWLTRVPT